MKDQGDENGKSSNENRWNYFKVIVKNQRFSVK